MARKKRTSQTTMGQNLGRRPQIMASPAGMPGMPTGPVAPTIGRGGIRPARTSVQGLRRQKGY